jgi:hypothetical protein
MAASSVNPGVAAGLGIAQLLTGMVQQKKANGLFPEVPPMYYDMLNEYKRKARNTEVGGLYSAGVAKNRNLLAQGSNAVIQTGNPMAYNFTQRKAGGLVNDILAAMTQRSERYDQLAGNMGMTIGGTQLQLDKSKWANAQAKASTNTRSGIDNILMGTLGRKVPNTPTTQTPTTNMMSPEIAQYLGLTPEKLQALQAAGLMANPL